MRGPSRFESFDRLLSETGAESMLRLCERFRHYLMYREESIEDDFGEGLALRHDAVLNALTILDEYIAYPPASPAAAPAG